METAYSVSKDHFPLLECLRFLLIPMLEFKLLQFVNVSAFIDVSPQSFQ